jgi:hypothetical protein
MAKLSTDCFIHLTKDGTSLLINNINDKVGILKHRNDQNETSSNGAPKRNKNVHVRRPRRHPCFTCAENNHSQNLMLDLNVINATVLVTKLNLIG